MMRTIALVARGALIYQNRPVAAGEVFEATPIDAAVLRYKRQVDFAPRGVRPLPSVVTPAITEAASTPAVRRHYQDKEECAAETPAPLVPDRTPEDDVEDPPAEAEKPIRKRRAYHRRDLAAED